MEADAQMARDLAAEMSSEESSESDSYDDEVEAPVPGVLVRLPNQVDLDQDDLED
jgi:hypothetical protein